MVKFFKQMAFFVFFPLCFFDAMLNRDPSYYLDGASRLIASNQIDPITFEFGDRTNPESERYQLHDITNFLMNDSVFTGKTGDRFFIVQRPSGVKEFFVTQEERDASLERNFSTTIDDLHKKPWYSGIRANVLFPYNLIYYSGMTVMLSIVAALRWRNRPNNEQADGEQRLTITEF